jgi:hypothetical protein
VGRKEFPENAFPHVDVLLWLSPEKHDLTVVEEKREWVREGLIKHKLIQLIDVKLWICEAFSIDISRKLGIDITKAVLELNSSDHLSICLVANQDHLFRQVQYREALQEW